LQQKAEQATLAAARAAAAQAAILATAQRAQAMASMTAQGQLTEALRQKCDDWAKNMPPYGNYKKQEANPNKVGFFQDADRLSKQALGSTDWSAHDKQALADVIEHNVSQVVAPWGKDERKKLKVSALRDQQP
ncbi:MAG: hypothetical protein K9K38_05345, partial [Rhodoferax sp.]|nr:hypothetical protein [Rhodoferax sp.]